MKKPAWILVPCSALLLIGCQKIQPEKTSQRPRIIQNTLASLRGTTRVNQIDLDYTGDCRMRIKTPRIDENGACRIIISRDNRLQLTVFSRIAGTLLSVYQDKDQIQVLNYHDKTALQLSNNETNRKRALEIVNLTGAEFRSIFWGREIAADRIDLRFLRDTNGQVLIRKDTPSSSQRVIIRKWLIHQGVRLPKTIDFEDRSRGITLKVVMTRITPGMSVELAPLHAPEDFRDAH